MKLRSNRFRRWATACLAGATSLTGLSVLALASPSSAAGSASGVLTNQTSPPPNLELGVANQPGGDWQIILQPGAQNGDVVIQADDFDESGAGVQFDHPATVTAPSVTGNAGFAITPQTPITPTANPGCNTTSCVGNSGTTTVGGDSDQLVFAYTASAPLSKAQPIDITDVSYDVGPSTLVSTTPWTGATPTAGALIVVGCDTDPNFADLQSCTNGANGIQPPNGGQGNLTPISPTFRDGLGNNYDPSASNGIILSQNPTVSLYANSTPVIHPSTTGAGGTWTITLTGYDESWIPGDSIYIDVARNDSLNCETIGNPDSVGFANAPSIENIVAATDGATNLPTFDAPTVQPDPNSSCSAFSGINNQLVLTFSNSGTINDGTQHDNLGHEFSIEFTLTNVNYMVSDDIGDAVGPFSNLGNIDVYSGFKTPATFGTTKVPNDTLNGGSTDGAIYGPSNADITNQGISVNANNPRNTFQFNIFSTGGEAINQPLGPITITENGPGAMGGGANGYVCFDLDTFSFPNFDDNAEWSNAGSPVATLGGGFGSTTVPVNVFTSGGQNGASYLAFQIPSPSTGSAGTVTLTGLEVNVPEIPLPLQGFLYYGASDPNCNIGAVDYGGNPITLGNVAGRTFGSTEDATSAQEANLTTLCPFFRKNYGPFRSQDIVNVVLVSNQSPQDALSASYLAGVLRAPILTSPTDSLSQDTLEALRISGATDVYVVGGPAAFSQGNVNQLMSTPVFNCDGSQHTQSQGGAVTDLTVNWVYGNNADGTSEATSTYFGEHFVGTGTFPGAYGGMYNQTSGDDGTAPIDAPDVPVSTAILTTDSTWQDAASASAIAYDEGFPLFQTGAAGTGGNVDTLSAEAIDGLEQDGIQQVLLMGGPVVNGDPVISQLESMFPGLSILRIAGENFVQTSTDTASFELNSTVSGPGTPTTGLDWDGFVCPELGPNIQPQSENEDCVETAPYTILFARGDYFSDGITASGLSGWIGHLFDGSFGFSPILLTWDNNTVDYPGTDYLGGFLNQVGLVQADSGNPVDGTTNNLWFVGGTAAITDSLASDLITDLNGQPPA